MTAPVLEARDLAKRFPIAGGMGRSGRVVHALNGVSLAVEAGETLAVVGESGCGKSTLANCLTGLMPPSAGSFLLQGEDATAMLRQDPMRFRRSVQIVFQDPYASLNPRRRIADTVGDALRIHGLGPRRDRRGRVAELLAEVGLAEEHLDRYPHELSGGQRQRVAIARALAVEPVVVICDEPVSALDVSIQAQVINLLRDVQRRRGVAYLFISHNLALVRHIARRIAVMYLGEVVEIGSTAALNRRMLHPYSRALFAAAPEIGRAADAPGRPPPLSGDVPSPIDPPPGCRFHTRCPHTQARCKVEAPALRPVDDRLVRCHFAEEIAEAA
ncbi:peptide/nickel transport system ATP-binding protein/dipeptide transport system ATP-binding protein [Stella humosa]|uniref:Peptide/nickel transport system ATP-binding protein/dipeptide transport system ATP-binding protein n=1 Tax=Stella humosa TaxID=94 RepID=A0A3N1KSL1_9PROT|nr:dipeptide ABC transporter ATP-binding protein [Stella humosa]ROP81380.1 peptide/nickel transport system ATP-binding protein/dipeptide transport system ATP-binding protein [Stella humosa]